MRIVITGARGRLGNATLEYARTQGANVLGVDSSQRGDAHTYLHADLTDLGETHDALAGADAVIHLAAIPHQRIYPSAKTFLTNVSMTYNVFDAAARLGIKRVVSASSIQVNRTAQPRSPTHFHYLPLDEAHPPDPQDEYGLSKLVGEASADMFARHWGLTIVSLRFTWIALPEDFASLPRAYRPDNTVLPGYVHVEDAARACYLAATADLPPRSHTVAFVSADDSPLDRPSREIAQTSYPDSKLLPELDGYASLVSGRRAAEAFGFVPQFRCHSEE